MGATNGGHCLCRQFTVKTIINQLRAINQDDVQRKTSLTFNKGSHFVRDAVKTFIFKQTFKQGILKIK